MLIIVDNVYKGFSFNRLSHDCHFDIDGDVLTAHLRSSSDFQENLYIAETSQSCLKRPFFYIKNMQF